MHFHAETEVAFLGHIVGRASLACDPGKISAVRAWHAPGSVKQVRQFVGFIGYYRRFIQDFAGLSEPLVALTRKGVPFAWTDRQQVAFDTFKTCVMNAPILGFPTEDGQFILDTDTSLFAMGGCSTNSRRIGRSSSHTSAGVSGCPSDGIARHAGRCWRRLSCVLIFGRIYGELSSLCVRITVHFGGCRSFGTVMACMLARWYILLGQFSVTFEYRPGAQHANADGLSRQCGQCLRPGCPVSSSDTRADNTDFTAELLD